MAKPGKPQQGSAVKVVEALVRPVVEAMGLRLWDVRFEKEGPDWFLRVLIDRDEPMDTDTCAEVSHAIDPLLDEADPIDQSYYLEVGSPGMGRRLTRPEPAAGTGRRRQCDPDGRGGELYLPAQERGLCQALR